MRVLINAYACSPNMGSEPGMAWNWCLNLAKYCELFIITEEEFRDRIEAEVPTLPQWQNMHFYYNPVTPEVRRMCWDQGDWRFYWYYRQWQKRTLAIAKEICKDKRIDIVHQLNMVGFREPGYLWKLQKPIVWGPIGGLGITPSAYTEGASLKWKLLFSFKDMISLMQLKYSPRIKHMINSANALVSSVPIARQRIKQFYDRDSFLIPETGCYDLNTAVIDKRNRQSFHILWVGRFIYTKRLDIALKAISLLKDIPNIHFHIVGTGEETLVLRYKELSKQLGLESICEWYGSIDNTRVHEMMRNSDLFLFTSIREATSTVIPEAINNCLPIVCFNICGFGPLVTERIGRKIDLSTPNQSIKEFAEVIKSLYYDRGELYKMSLNCHDELRGLLWEEKAKKMVEIYSKCVSNFAV